MKVLKTKGGSANEPFYKSRRVWAAGLTLLGTIVVVAFPEQFEILAPIFSVGATVLGLTSWTMPKKV